MFTDKELVEIQKRQDAELAAQRATLDEQRNHIHILESALTSAQTNVARLEEEVYSAVKSTTKLKYFYYHVWCLDNVIIIHIGVKI